MSATALRFDRYRLDLNRGVLLVDGAEVGLRPKTFAVLCHLAGNAGRLVSKEELFAAVWPNVVVTDDALVQCIGELRRGLGEPGAGLIKTIPRRGYRFEAEIATDEGAREAPSPRAPPAPKRPRRMAVVLALFFAAAVAGGALWHGRASTWQSTSSERPRAQAAIAVLPFVNQSGEAEREYFADGLTQDLINALGRFSDLSVMSWNAVASYKGKLVTPGAVARSLAVNYQLEGSVLRTSDRVRVIAQLVDPDGRVLWSERYEDALVNLLGLEDRIVAEIAGALAIRVTKMEAQRAARKPAASLEAYDQVLRARPALQRPTRANNVQARALLRKAVEADPNLAAAHAALAETYHIAVAMGWAESPTEYLERAEAAANKALGLDRSMARAHVTIGRVHLSYQRYQQAQEALERAIAANPNDAFAIAGRGNVLMWMGKTDAAIEALQRAQRIDPDLNAIDRFALSLAYYLKGRYREAAEQAEINLSENANVGFSRMVLAAGYAQLGRADDAARAVEALRRMNPGFDAASFGSKFLDPKDLRHMREGFVKAGLLDVRS
jgi:TolB-like protein/DNA-binding winged helix-turn-helix (wHTH) protein/Tfp pilus assembly protein PilF